MGILSKEQIENQISGWEFNDSKLERNFQFPDFKEALKFVNQIGQLAETAQHHPDIQISYNVVKLNLATHSENGVTEKDINLAKAIEDLI